MKKLILIAALLVAPRAWSDTGVTLYSNTTNYMQMRAPNGMTNNYRMVMPLAQGTTSQVLSVSGVSGSTMTLTFVTQSTGSGGVTPGSTNYIQNQTATVQPATFTISGFGGLGTYLKFGNNYLSDGAPSFGGAGNLFITQNYPLTLMSGSPVGNTFIGTVSNLTTGSRNTCVGGCTVLNTGTDNAAFASGAGQSLTSGKRNSMFGQDSAASLTGNDNVMMGFNSGLFTTTGSSNVFIGGNTALQQNSQAVDKGSIYIGFDTGSGGAAGNLTNAVAIGYKAVVTSSNTMQLGGTGSNGLMVHISSAIALDGNVKISSTVVLNGTSGNSGQVLTSGGAGTIPSWTTPAGAGGASALAVTTGTSAGFNSIISSPTGVLLANGAQFIITAQGNATAYMLLNASSVTLQGNNLSATYGTLASTQTWTGINTFASIALSSTSVTGNITLTSSNTIVAANCSSACTITLPSASTVSGKVFWIKSIGSGVMTIATTGGQTIDGSTTVTPNPNQNATIEVISDASNYLIL